jgi:NADPH:quinone reductase-like Zn-dependent oxidoreductase
MLTEFIAIQIARLSGFSPIITTASLCNSEHLSSLGATHVLDRRLSTAALKHAIAKITSIPITLAFDAVSLPDTQQAAHDILTAEGILIIVSGLNLENKSDDKEVRLVWGSFHPPSNHEMGKRFMPVLTQWLADGTIKVSRTSMQIHWILAYKCIPATHNRSHPRRPEWCLLRCAETEEQPCQRQETSCSSLGDGVKWSV